MNNSVICQTIRPYEKAEAAIVISTLLLAAGFQAWALAAIVNRPVTEQTPLEFQSRACPRKTDKLVNAATAGSIQSFAAVAPAGTANRRVAPGLRRGSAAGGCQARVVIGETGFSNRSSRRERGCNRVIPR
jgi:hypothetical protein